MAPHTASGEWQSFEVRMRHRRAERLVVRAEVALDEGFREDARNAIAEAGRLWPEAPGLQTIEARLTDAVSAPARRGVRRQVFDAAIGLSVASVVAAMVVLAMARTWREDAERHQPRAIPSSPAERPAPRFSTPAARDSVTIQTRAVRAVFTQAVPEEPARQRRVSHPAPAELSAALDRTTVSEPARPVADAEPKRVAQSPGHDDQPALKEAPTVIASLAPVHEAEAPVPSPSTPAPTTMSPVADMSAGSDSMDRAPAAPVSSGASRAPEAVPAKLDRRAAEPAAPSEAELVRGVLHRYADAYTRLDAAAAQAVWPSVNRAALSRAFDNLAEQEIALGSCAIDVGNATARASCAGSATWAPKIGSGGARTDARRWSFELRKSTDGWLISDARVQNR